MKNEIEEYFRQEIEKAFEEFDIPTYEVQDSRVIIKSKNLYLSTDAEMFFKSVEKRVQEYLSKLDDE